MKAFILAGGLGTRLRTVVNDRPKPMALINGRPFLQLILDKLEGNFSQAVISIGYKGELIKNYFKDRYKGLSIEYTEDSLLGTGGAVRNYLLHKAKRDDPLLVINGDTLVNFDVIQLCDISPDITKLCVISQPENTRYGGIEVDSKGNLLSINKDNTESKLINAGVYYLSPKIINEIYSFKEEKFSLDDLIDKICVKVTVKVIEQKGKFIDIGIPDDYLYLTKHYNEYI